MGAKPEAFAKTEHRQLNAPSRQYEQTEELNRLVASAGRIGLTL
jgi:hypothetical protein